jgi:signal peptidase II
MNLLNKLVKKENISSIFLIFLIFVLDRFSKIKILKDFGENSILINDFLNFNLIWNSGIGFGLLSFNSNLIYHTISIIIGLVVSLLFFIAYKSNTYEKIVYSIIIGGALGNLYDRVFYNAVPDFIDLHYGNFHWFTFNIADIFITIGIFAFLMKNFLIKTENEKD